jgi:hypothetical protein
MSSTQDISMDAGQLASSEAQAAVAATNDDMEFEISSNEEYDPNYDPNATLMDYNEMNPNGKDPVPALRKSTSGKEAASPDDREIKNQL